MTTTTEYGPIQLDKRGVFLHSIKEQNYALYQALQNQDEVVVLKYSHRKEWYYTVEGYGTISLVLETKGFFWWKEEVYSLIYQSEGKKSIITDLSNIAPLFGTISGGIMIYHITDGRKHTYIDRVGRLLTNFYMIDGNTYTAVNNSDNVPLKMNYTITGQKVEFMILNTSTDSMKDGSYHSSVQISNIFIDKDNKKYILIKGTFIDINQSDIFYKSKHHSNIIVSHQDKLLYICSYDWTNSLDLTYISIKIIKCGTYCHCGGISTGYFILKPTDVIKVKHYDFKCDNFVVVNDTDNLIVPTKKILYSKHQLWEISHTKDDGYFVKEIKKGYKIIEKDSKYPFVAGQHIVSENYGYATVIGLLFNPFSNTYTENCLIKVGRFDLIVPQLSLKISDKPS